MLDDQSLNYIVGKMIREHREQLGYTLKEAAEKAQIDENQLDRIERGKEEPHLLTFVYIAHAVQIKANAFTSLIKQMDDLSPAEDDE